MDLDMKKNIPHILVNIRSTPVDHHYILWCLLDAIFMENTIFWPFEAKFHVSVTMWVFIIWKGHKDVYEKVNTWEFFLGGHLEESEKTRFLAIFSSNHVKTIWCGYSKYPPRRGGYFEYPHRMVLTSIEEHIAKKCAFSDSSRCSPNKKTLICCLNVDQMFTIFS